MCLFAIFKLFRILPSQVKNFVRILAFSTFIVERFIDQDNGSSVVISLFYTDSTDRVQLTDLELKGKKHYNTFSFQKPNSNYFFQSHRQRNSAKLKK